MPPRRHTTDSPLVAGLSAVSLTISELAHATGLDVAAIQELERYGLLGVKSFTLEVDAQNAPALRLYEKLGFRQYAAVTYVQMEKPALPQGLALPGLRAQTNADAKALHELYLATTPAPVRQVDTRQPRDFVQGPIERFMAANALPPTSRARARLLAAPSA